MGLNDFLMWLATSAGASAVASWVLERIPAYAKIVSAEVKRWWFFLACVLMSVGSYCVLTYVPASVLQSVAPFFALIAATFVGVFTGTGFHKVDKL
jgi:hypothetical protein